MWRSNRNQCPFRMSPRIWSRNPLVRSNLQRCLILIKAMRQIAFCLSPQMKDPRKLVRWSYIILWSQIMSWSHFQILHQNLEVRMIRISFLIHQIQILGVAVLRNQNLGVAVLRNQILGVALLRNHLCIRRWIHLRIHQMVKVQFSQKAVIMVQCNQNPVLHLALEKIKIWIQIIRPKIRTLRVKDPNHNPGMDLRLAQINSTKPNNILTILK